jgi:hypothetical protein
LHPERSDPIKTVLQTLIKASHFVLDERYLYFDLAEDHQTARDRLKGDVVNIKLTKTICRIDLPDN